MAAGGIHIVQQSDCLSSIAHKYGIPDWRAICSHPNNAGFKAKRPNPNLIYPGDELCIPGLQPKEVECATDALHQFVFDAGAHLSECLSRERE